MTRLIGLGVGLVFFAGGCASDAAEPTEEGEVQLPAVDCAKETVPTYAQVTLFHTTCVNCHSSTKTLYQAHHYTRSTRPATGESLLTEPRKPLRLCSPLRARAVGAGLDRA